MISSPTKLVFIVDDEIALAESLSIIFEIKGFVVQVFDSAEQALVLINEGRSPDLILMDGNLPGMNGDEAIAAIRAMGHDGTILGISAADFEDSMKAAGACGFWPKPLEVTDFVEQILV